MRFWEDKNSVKSRILKALISQKVSKIVVIDFLGEILGRRKDMRKKNYKGRTEKFQIEKCEGICITYNELQKSLS